MERSLLLSFVLILLLRSELSLCYGAAGKMALQYQIEPGSIQKHQELVTFWLRKLQSESQPRQPQVRQRRTANCHHKTMALHESIYFGPDGSVTGSLEYPTPNFYPVQGQPDNLVLWEQICH